MILFKQFIPLDYLHATFNTTKWTKVKRWQYIFIAQGCRLKIWGCRIKDNCHWLLSRINIKNICDWYIDKVYTSIKYNQWLWPYFGIQNFKRKILVRCTSWFVISLLICFCHYFILYYIFGNFFSSNWLSCDKFVIRYSHRVKKKLKY